MSTTVQVILVIFASSIFWLLIDMLGQLKAIVAELQRLRTYFLAPPHRREENQQTWGSWPNMVARLLDEIQGDVRDFRRKMIGREPYSS